MRERRKRLLAEIQTVIARPCLSEARPEYFLPPLEQLLHRVSGVFSLLPDSTVCDWGHSSPLPLYQRRDATFILVPLYLFRLPKPPSFFFFIPTIFGASLSSSLGSYSFSFSWWAVFTLFFLIILKRRYIPTHPASIDCYGAWGRWRESRGLYEGKSKGSGGLEKSGRKGKDWILGVRSRITEIRGSSFGFSSAPGSSLGYVPRGAKALGNKY